MNRSFAAVLAIMAVTVLFTSGPGSVMADENDAPLNVEVPNSNVEIQTIVENVMGSKKTVLVGKDASERAVNRISQPQILHLITQGFFLENQTFGESDFSGQLSSGARSNMRYMENPLVRTGLAFSGASQYSNQTEGWDGLMTALDFSRMVFSKTDIVTLSFELLLSKPVKPLLGI